VREESLAHLLDAYRAGDLAAQDRLLKAVEPMLLRYVQRDMGAQARSLEQSVDLSQSLLLAFHIALSQGKAEMTNEAGLRSYLRTMVKNKLANRSDRNKAAKRGGGERPLSIDRGDEDEVRLQVPAENLTASMFVRVSEMRHRMRMVLTPEEESVLEGRLRGLSYIEIANDLGKTPDGVRMLWKRARDRLVERGIIEAPPQR